VVSGCDAHCWLRTSSKRPIDAQGLSKRLD
jgi:hypothetical protein